MLPEKKITLCHLIGIAGHRHRGRCRRYRQASIRSERVPLSQDRAGSYIGFFVIPTVNSGAPLTFKNTGSGSNKNFPRVDRHTYAHHTLHVHTESNGLVYTLPKSPIHTAGGGKEYSLHVHTAGGGGKAYSLHPAAGVVLGVLCGKNLKTQFLLVK
jgi:hypothetical protein